MTTDDAVSRAIRRASVASAGISVVLSPIPLADEIALVPVYAWLTMRVARARRKAARDVPWPSLAKVAVAGLFVRGAIDATVATVPGLSALVNATTAVGLTHVYGACVDDACAHEGPTRLGARRVFDAVRARWRRRSAEA